MANQPPTRPAYEIPSNVSAEAHAALDAAHAAHKRLGRAMVVTAAAAVCDILTGHEPHAPFDAAGVELIECADGSLFPSGRYWTTADIERTFTEAVGETEAEDGIHDMSEWTAYLNDDTRDVWRPLCSQLDDREGRPAYRLDLLRAAALPLTPPVSASPPSAMVDVMVCANDRDRYPAMVDPADQRAGYVKPWFDLDTVRRLAADTQREAKRSGHGSVDTVHVLDGVVDGKPHSVVLVVSWMYLGNEWNETATQVLRPNAVGRYAVGGHDWCWYALDDDLHPLIPFQPAAV
ncbi:hypothetical protein [Streptomyces milbemycinicus]|uniref:hypothetical protein n=1 Tax=Streptomyces milbemycinicus TaxID=476552 RepID=UPI000A372354|nr:hypothetical protein [Streptomyces milbemycinicus]